MLEQIPIRHESPGIDGKLSFIHWLPVSRIFNSKPNAQEINA